MQLYYLDDVFIGEGFVRFIVLGVFEQHLIHVSRGVLVQFVARRKDDKCYLTVAEHRQFVRLLHYSKLSLVESHL